ncbi:obscurin-like [Mercenaria mercenaria]|uniref:obscurin-like n=1 Tax=Mercenaria mercenaria TaxID=6596 RepID=UPI00234F3A61|nr:obscurin-like [Mercenaria mercenaria]
MSEEDITRGHELYLRHLLLLEQAAPESLKAVIEREVSKRGKSLAYILAERKDTFNKYHNAEFRQLFKGEEAITDIDLWDTVVLCTIVQVLFDSHLATVEREAIKIIKDQRNNLDSYAHSASINYKTFEEKWDPLNSALLELITGIHDEKRKFECTRMIHSFKSEHIRVSLDLIKRIKQTNDVKVHLQMVIQDKVAPKIHGDMDETCDKDEKDDHKNPVFTESLRDMLVYVGDPAILTCKLNVPENAVTWRHDYKLVEQTETLKFLTDRCAHWLAISCAELSDTGEYSCCCGRSSTKSFLQVLEKRLKIVKDLHVATIEPDVRENMDIVLICKVNLHTSTVVWRQNGDEIISCNRRLSSVNVLEHRLTIKKAQFEDEGDYTVHFGSVSSCAKLVIKGTSMLA